MSSFRHIAQAFLPRWIDAELGVQSLTPMDSIQERRRIWHPQTGRNIHFHLLNLASEYERLKAWLAETGIGAHLDYARVVFIARPAPATFDAMLARLDQPDAFWRRTDQTFLESCFPNWHGLPVFDNMLQYVWLNLPQLWRWQDIRVLHCQYEEPWKNHAKSDRPRVLIELWQAQAAAPRGFCACTPTCP